MANRDPVCGKEVDALRARAVGIWGGRTYYFCSPEHKLEFARSPSTFGEHGPREPSHRVLTPSAGGASTPLHGTPILADRSGPQTTASAPGAQATPAPIASESSDPLEVPRSPAWKFALALVVAAIALAAVLATRR